MDRLNRGSPNPRHLQKAAKARASHRSPDDQDLSRGRDLGGVCVVSPFRVAPADLDGQL
jgi:hypothetical protein